MKQLLLSLIVAGALGVPKAYSQFNPMLGCYLQDSILTATAINNTASVAQNTNGITCNANHFFATDNPYGNITEFSLSGTTVAVTSTILTNTYNISLAYCNNLDGGTFSPTFYSTANYYDGASWAYVASPGVSINNSGGNGNFLYYMTYDTYNRGVIRYDGVNYTNIYTCPFGRIICVADIAVDDLGNAFIITGPESSNIVSDSLIVLSPNGQVIKKFSFSFNSYNAYGAFILNNVYYVGLGPSNPMNPNTLIPITFSGNSVSAGQPIAMPATPFPLSDFASCNPGKPLSMKNNDISNEWTIYPNPFHNETTVTFASTQENCIIILTDMLGKEVRKINFSGKELSVEKNELEAGMYFLQVIDKTHQIISRKLIIE